MLRLEYSRLRSVYRVSRRWVNRTCKLMIEHFPMHQTIPTIGRFQNNVEYSFSVALVDDVTIHKLNKRFRGKDSVTDVLSIEGEHDFFVTPKELACDLGEVIISYPQTKRQAKQHQVSVRFEFEKLLVHGFLHALGFDHINDKDARIMVPLEGYMKKMLDSNRPLY